jgi:hypothetical protein
VASKNLIASYVGDPTKRYAMSRVHDSQASALRFLLAWFWALNYGIGVRGNVDPVSFQPRAGAADCR